MKSLLLATAMGFVLTAPAMAQQTPAAQNPQSSAAQSQRAMAESHAARMISAKQLIRKTVETADKQTLGSVDYIAVDPASGKITTLLIRATGLQDQSKAGQGGNQGGQQGKAPLLAMPWHAVDISQGRSGNVIAKIPMKLASQVPTFTDAEISQITSPRVMTQLVEYYAPAPQAQTGAQENQAPQMVVGHGLVGMLTPPAITTVDQMQGLAITTPDGSQIGQVASIMINVEQGAVSYLLALQQSDENKATQNIPPVGTGYIPIAYQDIELAADGQSFILAPEAVIIGVVAVPQGQQQAGGKAAQDRQAQSGGQQGNGAEADGRRQSANSQAQQATGRDAAASGGTAGQSAQLQAGGQSGKEGLDRYVERPEQSGGNTAGQQAGNKQSGGSEQQPAGNAQAGTVSRAVLGVVQSIDQRSRTLTLENGSSFQLAQGVDPSGIASGDPVRVSYHVRGNEYQAVSVEPAPESALSGKQQPDAATGLVDGTDAPGATDDLQTNPGNNQ